MILMGKTDPAGDKHLQQSMVLVPMNTPGITLLRPMQVMGDADAPKGHMDILYGKTTHLCSCRSSTILIKIYALLYVVATFYTFGQKMFGYLSRMLCWVRVEVLKLHRPA